MTSNILGKRKYHRGSIGNRRRMWVLGGVVRLIWFDFFFSQMNLAMDIKICFNVSFEIFLLGKLVKCFWNLARIIKEMRFVHFCFFVENHYLY